MVRVIFPYNESALSVGALPFPFIIVDAVSPVPFNVAFRVIPKSWNDQVPYTSQNIFEANQPLKVI